MRGGEGAARIGIRLLRAAINRAIGEGLVVSNPCHGVSIGTDGTRDVILEDIADYRRLFETLDRMERERRLRPAVADAIRVIALTERAGAKSSACAGNMSTSSAVSCPAAAVAQAGRRTGKPRIIGLPPRHRPIIARQTRQFVNDLVFLPS